METTNVRDFLSFIQQIEVHATRVQLALFRGQARHGNLVPKVARVDLSTDTSQFEREMLAELRRIGGAFLSDAHNNDWELLVVAQHFGMATRLLDWTSNPMAALWFAASSHQAGDCYVYRLVADSHVTPDHDKGPFDQTKTRVFRPRLNNPRIVAQDGWFTAHRFSKKSGRFVPLEKNPDIHPHITEFVIPAAARKGILRSLDRHGISSRTLFPDLEGLCRYITWKFDPT
jgi:hypothetical protein